MSLTPSYGRMNLILQFNPINRMLFIFIIREKVGLGEDHPFPSVLDRGQGLCHFPALTLYGLTGIVMVLFKSLLY